MKVSVKWQKELFPAVEIDTSQPPFVFKCQLYDLTGVPPERQKIMDDADWSTIGVKEGQRLMMMGTADEIVKAPEKGPVFVEDLPEEEQAVSAVRFGEVYCDIGPAKSYTDSGRRNEVDYTSHLLTVATRDLFSELDRSGKPVAPMHFWTVLRKKYPQFSQQHNGLFMQQDAEECWTQLMYTLSQSLKSPESRENPEAVKSLFGIELVSRTINWHVFGMGIVPLLLRGEIIHTDDQLPYMIHCAESGEESSETESVYSLKCHISQEVNHLHEGLKHGLKSELEKVLNYTKVDYPLELDVYDLCSDELRAKLQAPRKALRDAESTKLGLKVSDKNGVSKDNDVKMLEAERSITDLSLTGGTLVEKYYGNSLEGSFLMEFLMKFFISSGSSDGNVETSKATPEEGTSSDKQMQLTGIYDLVAVLTHKGRSADSGHYVAWAKQENEIDPPGKWIEFDDDHPIPQREEDITKLSGGGRHVILMRFLEEADYWKDEHRTGIVKYLRRKPVKSMRRGNITSRKSRSCEIIVWYRACQQFLEEADYWKDEHRTGIVKYLRRKPVKSSAAWKHHKRLVLLLADDSGSINTM
ncbi:deubiquitinating enzyme [Asimina triloba]